MLSKVVLSQKLENLLVLLAIMIVKISTLFLLRRFIGLISSLNPTTGTHMFNETKSIIECIKKCAIVFVTIRFTTEDQCIPTITKLNIKKATTGLDVIFNVLINGLTEISFFHVPMHTH